MSEVKPTDYAISQKVFHWLIALLVLIDLTVAQQFSGDLELSDRLASRGQHASVGTIILTLMIIRIILRLNFGAPAYPASMPALQKLLARATHFGLYALLIFVIATGLITGMNATAPVSIFGLFDIAITGNSSEQTFQSVRIFHEFATKLLIGFISVHVIAALYHLFVVRDQIATRMLKFWSSN